MIQLFCGYDRRERPGFHTFVHSVIERSSQSVHFIPMANMGFRRGSNEFTLSRFMVARECGYRGHAIFCDASDMLAMGDIAELNSLFDPRFAVQVVKHPEYKSAHDRKYIGEAMECEQSNYPRKNWASVMVVNCGHSAWREAERFIAMCDSAAKVLQFGFLHDEQIGEIPPQWNVLVDEGQDDTDAKILHWTAGIPGFMHYQNARHSRDWFEARRDMCGLTTAAHR